MLGVDTCRCDSIEGVTLIKGDLKGMVCRLLAKLGNELRNLVGVGSASACLRKEVGVGVSGACMEENALLAEENITCGEATWVERSESGSLSVGSWSGRRTSSCHFLIFSSASCKAAADGTKSDLALSPLIDGLWKPGIAVVAEENPTNELVGLNHAA